MTDAGREGLRHGQASQRESAQQGTGGAWPPRFGRMRLGIGDKMELFGDINIGDLEIGAGRRGTKHIGVGQVHCAPSARLWFSMVCRKTRCGWSVI